MSAQERPAHASFHHRWQGLGSALPFLLLCDALTMLIALPLMSALDDRHTKSRLMAWGLLTAVVIAVGLAMMASVACAALN